MEVAEPVEDISPAAPQQVPYQSRISARRRPLSRYHISRGYLPGCPSAGTISVEDTCPAAPQQVPYQSRISARLPLSRYHISRGYQPGGPSPGTISVEDICPKLQQIFSQGHQLVLTLVGPYRARVISPFKKDIRLRGDQFMPRGKFMPQHLYKLF
jgi:hypothetical protein